MRSDMSKVLTTRARYGSRSSFRELRRPLRLVFDDGEVVDAGRTKEGMRRAASEILGWDRKQFSDLTGPLERFLLSQVGRPWDKVKSEIAAHVPKDSTVHIHLWQHVEREVTEKCYRDTDGVIRESDGRALDPHGWHRPLLYVLEDGILRKTKPRSKAERIRRRPPEAQCVAPSDDPRGRLAVLWKGQWYEVSDSVNVRDVIDPVRRNELMMSVDVFIQGSPYYRLEEWRETPHGRRGYIALSKRQMSRKERERHKL